MERRHITIIMKGIATAWLSLMPFVVCAQREVFTVVELNVENLFDTDHDTLKDDHEFLPDGSYHWTRKRYWRKLNRLGQTILSCGEQKAGDRQWILPDMVALCEVENDTVMRDLTKRSLLRNARYEYIVTQSPDERGVDVALLYSPFSFRPIRQEALRVPLVRDMRPTRDILYVEGETVSGDTLHVFVVHAPSRSGGEKASRPFRRQVADRLCHAVDSLHGLCGDARIIVVGDFNDYHSSPALVQLEQHGLVNVSKNATGTHGAKATYRYQGEWGSLDHIFLSPSLAEVAKECYINDAAFLLEEDTKYGGVKPRRNYLGPRYLNGYSDHLPLVLRLFF